jgi:pilus assembly protein FimV
MGSSGVPARRDFASDTQSSGARFDADDMLDLDIDGPNAATMPQKRPTSVDAATATATRAAPADNGLDFDLGTLSLDEPAPGRAQETSVDFDDFALEPDNRNGGIGLGDADPLARKLELAEEFRQIGDLEGARDLLEEVLAKAAGPLKGKAQSMLDQLS